jgi:hypothetical protein
VATPTGAQECELTLVQQFQALSGSLRIGDKDYEIEEGKLEGDRILLRTAASLGGTGERYRIFGQVADGSITGTLSILDGGTERTLRFVSSLQGVVR